jgi:hypothetical protein
VSTLDPRLEEQFDRLVPAAAVNADWQSIVQRAIRRTRRRRLVQLGAVAAALILAASPVGAAIFDGVNDFSAWLRGEPGSPAPESDQRAFERSNSRSWAGFPRGTKLRSLIETEVGGHEFDLLGFRSGGSLCLRLVARGLNESPAQSCAPVAELERASAPVVVVQADHGFGLASKVPEGADAVAPQAQASFGIVADGVDAVELETDDGSHRAIVAANSFLYVADKPKLGTRVRKVFALDANGRKSPVPFQSAPFGVWDSPAPAHDRPAGPSTVERQVEGGTIAWLLRREERGEAPPADAPFVKALDFARLIAPDPKSHMRVLVGVSERKRWLCAYRVSGGAAGGGCSPLENPFPRGPFTLAESRDYGGDQYSTLSGLASDEVARLQLFLATGETRPIPLRDNAWVVQAARADHPVRVVAYDSEDRIIGIQDLGGEARIGRPVGEWRTILTVPDRDGQLARVRIAASTDGGRCYEIRTPGGGGSYGCRPRASLAERAKLSPAITSGRDGAWLSGQVSDDIVRVDIVFRNGKIVPVEPTEGFILTQLGAGTSVVRNGVARVVARDRAGHEVAVYRP